MRQRVFVSAALLAVMVGLVGPAQATTTTVTHSQPCTLTACSNPAYRRDTYSVNAGTSQTAPAVCALQISGTGCVVGVQGDPNQVPGTGTGETITVGTGGAATVVITACNNKTNPTNPSAPDHCPNITRVSISVTTNDNPAPSVTVSQACVVVLGDTDAVCKDYP